VGGIRWVMLVWCYCHDTSGGMSLQRAPDWDSTYDSRALCEQAAHLDPTHHIAAWKCLRVDKVAESEIGAENVDGIKWIMRVWCYCHDTSGGMSVQRALDWDSTYDSRALCEQAVRQDPTHSIATWKWERLDKVEESEK
jgi:hypothetical protein